MKKTLQSVLTLFFIGLLFLAQAHADSRSGQEFFNSVEGGNCRTCHYTNNVKLVGPGLQNIMDRHSEEWIRMWLSDPQKTWETDHPETIDLKKRVHGLHRKYTRCQKKHITTEVMDNLIDFFKTLTVKR